MLTRLRCPITQGEDLQTDLDLPFDSGVLGQWAAERGHKERLAKARFVILQNRAIGFRFQSLVFDQGEEVQRREGIAEKMAAIPAKLYSLTELAHRAEDAMLIRLLAGELDRRPR